MTGHFTVGRIWDLTARAIISFQELVSRALRPSPLGVLRPLGSPLSRCITTSTPSRRDKTIHRTENVTRENCKRSRIEINDGREGPTKPLLARQLLDELTFNLRAMQIMLHYYFPSSSVSGRGKTHNVGPG